MDKKTILVIEDEEEIRCGIHMLLGDDDFTIIEAENGLSGLALLDEDTDIVILDIIMPGLDGLRVCELIRQRSSVPILFLTAKAQEIDKLTGLRCGADDYLTKPFSYSELLARVKALIRRYRDYCGREQSDAVSGGSHIEIDGIRIAKEQNEASIDGVEVNLTEKEYQILKLLMQHPNRSFSTKILYEEIWKEPYFYCSNSTVIVHVGNLRKKIEPDPQDPTHIVTTWGKGYQFRRQVIS